MALALAHNINPKSNTFVFIICALIALAFWFLKSLDQEYKTQVAFPITYKNFPKDRILKDSLPEKVRLSIKGTGWDIMSIETGSEIYPIMIDYQKAKKLNEVVLTEGAFLLDEKVPEEVDVLNISPDTLNINFDKRTEKTVPVKLNGEITYKDNHALSDSIQVLPSKVHIEGPQSYLKRIDHLKTKTFRIEKVNDKLIKNIPLKQPAYPFVSYNKKAVKLIIPVEKLTERTIAVPVKLDNPYFKSRIELVPSQVKIRFQTVLSRYDEITPEDFEAFVYTKRTKQENRARKLKVHLAEKPDFIYNIRMKPDHVNYLIRNDKP